MPARFRRLAMALPVLLALAVFTGASPAPATAATPFVYDTFFPRAYERQVDSRTCTAASTAMMMNILAGRDLRMRQLSVLRYSQPRDALNDKVQRGSDPLGWSRAATHFSQYTSRPTTYRWEAYATEAAALKRAAVQIARTGKPVGLLVKHGRHAVVMTGFTSTRNPLRGSFKLTGIFYSDPLGTRHALVAAASSPLDDYRELDATPSYDAAWYRKFIVIVPLN
jgi:hypothetical protein